MTDQEILHQAGFGGFVHLRKTERDGKKRLTWTGVRNDCLFTIRVVASATGWQVDYVSPEGRDIEPFLANCSVAELVAFIAPLS